MFARTRVRDAVISRATNNSVANCMARTTENAICSESARLRLRKRAAQRTSWFALRKHDCACKRDCRKDENVPDHYCAPAYEFFYQCVLI